MERYSFRKHKCILSIDGFDTLPYEVEKACEDAIFFCHFDGTFVLGEIDAFCEYRDKILESDDRTSNILGRYLCDSIMHLKSVEDLVEILWNSIHRRGRGDMNSKEIKIELCPYNMVFFKEKSKNQFIKINILGSTCIGSN